MMTIHELQISMENSRLRQRERERSINELVRRKDIFRKIEKKNRNLILHWHKELQNQFFFSIRETVKKSEKQSATSIMFKF